MLQYKDNTRTTLRNEISLIIAWCWSTIKDDIQTHSHTLRLLCHVHVKSFTTVTKTTVINISKAPNVQVHVISLWQRHALGNFKWGHKKLKRNNNCKFMNLYLTRKVPN